MLDFEGISELLVILTVLLIVYLFHMHFNLFKVSLLSNLYKAQHFEARGFEVGAYIYLNMKRCRGYYRMVFT